MKRTRDGQSDIGQAVDPVASTRTSCILSRIGGKALAGKRPRTTHAKDYADDGEDDHEEPRQHCKRLKVQADSRELQRPSFEKILRRSLRLRTLQESRDQLSSREERAAGRPSAAARHRGFKGAQSRKKAWAHPQNVKRQDSHSQGNPQRGPLKSLTGETGKGQRDVVSGDEPTCASKRQRQQSVSRVSVAQADSIEHWLDESYPCQAPSITDKDLILEATAIMPRKSGGVLPSPEDSFDRTTTSSRKSERTTASVHDSDYRQSLRHRNVNIEREDAPIELMRRAHRIISRPRASPEMDDIAVRELKKKSRQLQEDAEEEIVQQLAPSIIPAMSRLPDERLARNADQPWATSVPLPLDPSILTNPLPLPKPKPDLAFGYSQAAFTRNQLATIELLVDDQFGRSFAAPDQKLRFPFLDIEFKSQAKNGTHYIATNQAAGAGAIALRGTMDLMERSFGMEKFDYEEPHFFSVTMDHQLACVNVHWLKIPVDRRIPSFHVEGLSQHLLKDADGIRAITRAVKNILDYGTDKRLQTLCEALDKYRDIVIRNREAADPQRVGHEAQGKVQPLEETTTTSMRHAYVPKEASADELIKGQRRAKHVRHGSSGTQNVEWSKRTISRHPGGNATIAEEPKRQVKPSQKLLESRKQMINRQGVRRRDGPDF